MDDWMHYFDIQQWKLGKRPEMNTFSNWTGQSLSFSLCFNPHTLPCHSFLKPGSAPAPSENTWPSWDVQPVAEFLLSSRPPPTSQIRVPTTTRSVCTALMPACTSHPRNTHSWKTKVVLPWYTKRNTMIYHFVSSSILLWSTAFLCLWRWHSVPASLLCSSPTTPWPGVCGGHIPSF